MEDYIYHVIRGVFANRGLLYGLCYPSKRILSIRSCMLRERTCTPNASNERAVVRARGRKNIMEMRVLCTPDASVREGAHHLKAARGHISNFTIWSGKRQNGRKILPRIRTVYGG